MTQFLVSKKFRHVIFFYLLRNHGEKDAKTALGNYRECNGIEVLFDDLKNELDCERPRVHSSRAMYGRLFVQFIALILLSVIRQVIMEKGEPFSKYATTYRDVLRRVSSFSKVEFEGKYKPLYSIPAKGASLIFEAFENDVPS